MITAPILPIAGTAQASSVAGARASAGSAPGAGGTSFTGMIERAVSQLGASLTNADQLAMRLAAGEDVDLHQVMVAMESASIGLQTAIQVRNKALEAYREIMGMPI